MNNETPDSDIPENDHTEDDQPPNGQTDEGEFDEEVSEDAGLNDILEIGIPISETLTHASAETPEVPRSTEPPDMPVTNDFPSYSMDGDSRDSGYELLSAVKLRIDDLAQAFEAKLKYDEHKNKIIDDLHQSLQQHREGLLKKYLHRIVMDVIKIVDDMRKLTAHYHQQSHSSETSVKLLKYIENITADLEDMFSWEGVTPFTCDGDTVDTARQRVLGKIETNDPEKDKTIAERLRPGYEWDGKIIRPEMVSVYAYQTNSPSGE